VERQLCACVFTSAVSGYDVIKWCDDAIKSRLEKEWCGDPMFGCRVLHPVHCGSKLSLGPGFHHVTNVDYKCSYGRRRQKNTYLVRFPEKVVIRCKLSDWNRNGTLQFTVTPVN